MRKMSTEIIKRTMADAYSRMAQEYGVARNKKFDSFLQKEMDDFIASLAAGSRIIDLGSGPGNESIYFKQAGFYPVCVDIAVGMVEECRRKGLEAYEMDFYHLDFPDENFAGAWMHFSLLHVPKGEVKRVIEEVNRVLSKGGIFYVSLFEGEGEGFRKEDIKKFGVPRYFSYYQQSELREVLSPYFDIIKEARLDISPRPTISFQGKKR